MLLLLLLLLDPVVLAVLEQADHLVQIPYLAPSRQLEAAMALWVLSHPALSGAQAVLVALAHILGSVALELQVKVLRAGLIQMLPEVVHPAVAAQVLKVLISLPLLAPAQPVVQVRLLVIQVVLLLTLVAVAAVDMAPMPVAPVAPVVVVMAEAARGRLASPEL